MKIYKLKKMSNSSALGKSHVLKHDFLTTMRGGSSSPSNDGGCDDWIPTKFCDKDSQSLKNKI